MSKRIYVDEGSKKKLREIFGVNRIAVWRALNFESDSEKARKIRYVALSQMGGVPNWKPDEVETTHEECERTMTQRFSERVKLVASKTDTSVWVYVDGKEVRHEECKSVASLMELQNEVGLMAMSL